MLDASERALAREIADSREVQAYLAYPGWTAFVGRGDGIVLWANANTGDVLGHRPQDMVGRNAWELLIAAEDVPQAAALRALMSEGDVQIWANYKASDGSKHWFRVEILGRRGLYLAVLHREPDANLHRWHGRIRHA